MGKVITHFTEPKTNGKSAKSKALVVYKNPELQEEVANYCRQLKKFPGANQLSGKELKHYSEYLDRKSRAKRVVFACTFKPSGYPDYKGAIFFFLDGTAAILVKHQRIVEGKWDRPPMPVPFFYADDSPLRFIDGKELAANGYSYGCFGSCREAFGHLATFFFWFFHRVVLSREKGDIVPDYDEDVIPVVTKKMIEEINSHFSRPNPPV